MQKQDPFAVLRIEKTDSLVEIHRAWRNRARVVHPDIGGSDAAMQELNEAVRLAIAMIDKPQTLIVPPVRRERDDCSFSVDATPVECFEALRIVAGMCGDMSYEEAPYQLEFSLYDSGVSGALQGWCRCELLPEAASTVVSLLVGTLGEGPRISVEEVRDFLVACLNSLDWSR